jgi:hypothetical protein
MVDGVGLYTYVRGNPFILTDPLGHEGVQNENERVAQSNLNELGTYLKSLSSESRAAFREGTTGKFRARVQAHLNEQKLDVAVRFQEVKIEGSTTPDWDSVEVLPIGPADHWGGTPAAPAKPPPTEREKVEQNAALALGAMERWAHILDYWASMGGMPQAAGAAARGEGLISTGTKLGKKALGRLGVGIAGQAKRAGAPWFEPVPNPGGEVRTLPKALKLPKKSGVDVDPETFAFKLHGGLPSNVGAEYGSIPGVDPRGAPRIVEMDQFIYRLPDGRMMIRVNPNILSSDENIVGTLAHETHEAQAVEAEFISQGRRMRADVLHRLVNSETGTAHVEAWEFADKLVRLLRGRPGGG